MSKTWIMLAAACAMALPARPAVGQEILLLRPDVFRGTAVVGGLNMLGVPYTITFNSEEFLDELARQEWDLVLVRTLDRFDPAFEASILVLLDRHVERGGKLHFQMAELDRAPPAYLSLLGLNEVVELALPLRPVVTIRPRHPAVARGGMPVVADPLPPDYGDVPTPASNGFVVATYGDRGDPAILVCRSGRVILNGQQWDNWGSGEGLAADQIAWLLSCPPDLDGDGELTVFDFLEFQDLFDASDPRADVFYDGRLDIFDFLAFFNQFQAGC